MLLHRCRTKVLRTFAIALATATTASVFVGVSPAFALGWQCGGLTAQVSPINPSAPKAAVTAPDGYPVVFFIEQASGDLRVAERTTFGWGVATLDGNSTAGGR